MQVIEMNSAIWFGFALQDGVNKTNERMLIETAKNFFSGIPSDHRSDLYTSVNAFVLECPGADAPTPSEAANSQQGAKETASKGRISTTKGKEEDGPPEPPKTERILFVALFHEDSHLKNLEDFIPNGIFASRTIRRLDVQFEFDKTFDELYEESAQFVGE